MRQITITAGSITASAVLNDSTTADAIWEALPITARASTWGDEIYFGIPVHLDEANDAKETCFLHLFRAHPDEPWQRDPPRERSQCLWQGRRRPARLYRGHERLAGHH